MAKYRGDLPQLSGDLFLTDGGLETTLVFHDGLDLPFFAAFDLLKASEGKDLIRKYFESYVPIAEAGNLGMILDTPTWRANADWGKQLGYSDATLADANRRSVDLLCELRDAHEGSAAMVISGCIGPRGDGYNPATWMGEDEARVNEASTRWRPRNLVLLNPALVLSQPKTSSMRLRQRWLTP